MIGKLIKGGGARGLAEYLLGSHDMNGDERPRVAVIGGTMAGTTPREISAEFGELRRLRPRLSRAVAHQCLRLPEGDPIPDDATWSRIADRWAEQMGFEAYTVVCHGDHIHVAASRINPNGDVVSDAHDWRRSEAAIRVIEAEFGLTQVESSHLLEPERETAHRKAPNRGQMAMAERGEVPPSAIVAELIDGKLAEGCSASALVEHLEAHGVAVRPNIAGTGRVSGMVYELDGIEVSAKAMGRGFTWSNLQKRGMSYDEDRDLPRIREAGYRAAGAGDAGPGERTGDGERANRPPAPVLEPDARADRQAHLASGGIAGSHGQDDQRDLEPGADQPDRDRAAEGRPQEHRGDAGASGPQAGGHRSEARQEPAAGRPEAAPQGTDRRGDRGGDPVGDLEPGSDLERLVVLAVSASRNRAKGAGDVAADRPADKGLAQLALRAVDRTRQAVTSYLEALPAASYRLQIVRPDTANVNRTGQTPEAVLKALPWLKAENARGADIYIRPEDRRFVLLDDVTPATVERLKADGLAPAAVMETSRGNFAAWVQVAPPGAPEPSPEAATAIAQGLAKAYGADPSAADYAHVSRLPGFTNRKPSRQVDGKAPFVLLREATGRVAEAGAEIIERVAAFLDQRARRKAILAAPEFQPAADRRGDPATAYRSAMRRHVEKQGKAVDYSTADFRAAQDMAVAGWSRDQIAKAIEEASPSVTARKGQATAGYASRTATKAVSSDIVQSALARQAKEAEARQKALQEQRAAQEREEREAARRLPRPW